MKFVVRALVGALWLALVCSCGGARFASFRGQPGPYDVLDDRDRELLVESRSAFDDGRLEPALKSVEALLVRRPTNVFAAALRQDIELQWLGEGRPLPKIERDLAAARQPIDGSPAVRLRRWYRLATELEGARAFDFIVAARVEDDEVAAMRLLDRAIELDAKCIWGHYGRAFVLLRQGDLAGCRASLERAIELDPSHPRVRRLEATLLERLSEGDAARELLAQWTQRVADDPRVSDAEVVDANLDLAHYDLVARHPQEALARLNAVQPADPQRRARQQLLIADGWAALERWDESLEAARLARSFQSSSFLSWVQEAMVLQRGLGDLEGALEAWRAAAEVAAQLSAVDAGAAFTAQRARVEILRLERRIAEQSKPAESEVAAP